jgi:hypothetical protein
MASIITWAQGESPLRPFLFSFCPTGKQKLATDKPGAAEPQPNKQDNHEKHEPHEKTNPVLSQSRKERKGLQNLNQR